MRAVGVRSGRGLIAAMVAAGLAVATTVAMTGVAGALPAVPEVQLVLQLAPSAAAHPSSVLGGLPGSTPQGLIGDRFTFAVPEGEVAGTLSRLRAQEAVTYAAEVRTVHATGSSLSNPDDPCYTGSCRALYMGEPGTSTTAHQSDLAQVGAPAAWAVTNGSPAVKVAVLDTGVDHLNEDFGGNVTIGPNLCEGEGCGTAVAGDDDVPPPTPVADEFGDESGHGTHVTGTLAAATDNGAGVASLGERTSVEVFKVLDGTGGGTTSNLVSGIYDAVASGARVINMSLGNDACSADPSNCGPDPDTQAAVEYAQAHDVVVVAAAGNDGSTGPTYPASYPGVLSVASVNAADTTSSFSEYGAAADISAPGEDIVSTWNTPVGVPTTTLSTLSGTSMATPHVAAAAALVLAANPSLHAAQVTSLLRETASPETGNPIDGGVLDVGRAVEAARTGGIYEGYAVAGADGSVYPFGADPSFGDLAGHPLNKPIVALAERPDHTGYWMAASDGGVFQFGSAGFYGSTGDVHLNQPIVGMAATPDGRGYWLVASDGGVFDFGDAGFYGSTGDVRLNRPIVGMAATPDGRGYWLVASDGGVFDFGDARFYGSTGNVRLNKPVVGMAPAPGGDGYWLVASDGGVFDFGAAPFHGSTGNVALNRPIVGIQGTSDGAGYWFTASDGGIFCFGDARFEGSAAASPVPAPLVGIS